MTLCGSSLITAPRGVTIQRFRRGTDNALLCGEDEWDMLRAEIAAEVAKGSDVKEEELSDIEVDEVHAGAHGAPLRVGMLAAA